MKLDEIKALLTKIGDTDDEFGQFDTAMVLIEEGIPWLISELERVTAERDRTVMENGELRGILKIIVKEWNGGRPPEQKSYEPYARGTHTSPSAAMVSGDAVLCAIAALKEGR